MNSIILAAGIGSRLKNITQDIPKPMLKIQGQVILEHNIEWLKRYGMKDFYVNLHYLPDVIKEYFADGSKFDVNINYSYEADILGTAGAVKKIVTDFSDQGWDKFFVAYGDNFYPFECDLKKLMQFHDDKETALTIGFYKKKSEIHKSGVAILDDDNSVLGFIEKPSPSQQVITFNDKEYDIFECGLINTGFYCVSKEVVGYIPDGPCDFGRDIFPRLLKVGVPVHGFVFDESIIPIDTVELYEKAVKNK